MKKILTSGIIALTLAACGGGGNAANEKNFKKAINQINAGEQVCIPFNLKIQMPDGSLARQNSMAGERLLLVSDRDSDGRRINQAAEKQIEILTDNGFYKKEKTESQTLPMPDKTADITITAYSLTEKGAKQTVQGIRSPLLCIGSLEAKKIDWYTTPATFRGTIISKISYQAELKPARWAEKLIKESGEEEWSALKQPSQKIATLVQTNKGWISPRSLFPRHPDAE